MTCLVCKRPIADRQAYVPAADGRGYHPSCASRLRLLAAGPAPAAVPCGPAGGGK